MPETLLIKNMKNNNVLRCKFLKNCINLGLINGNNMRGVAIPIESVLERTPAYDSFIKSALKNGFTPNHIDDIEILAMLNYISNQFENDDSHEDYGLKEDY